MQTHLSVIFCMVIFWFVIYWAAGEEEKETGTRNGKTIANWVVGFLYGCWLFAEYVIGSSG